MPQNLIQFPSTVKADFIVNPPTDPNGAPANVLDLTLGFSISGQVKFPNWMTGTGKVAIYADEVGGHIDKMILSTEFAITATSGVEPDVKPYNWTVTYPANCPAGGTIPDPSSPGSRVYRLVAVFTFGGQPTDIGTFVELGPYMMN